MIDQRRNTFGTYPNFMQQWFMLVKCSVRRLVLYETEHNPKFNEQALKINLIVLEQTMLHGFFILKRIFSLTKQENLKYNMIFDR